MDWGEFILHTLNSDNDFDNLQVSLDEGQTICSIPPIIQASISMLDKIQLNQGIFNIFVFPERSQSFFVFTLMELFHCIIKGQIGSNYDPTGFVPGEKIKVGNTISEYLGFYEKNGKQYMKLRFSDLTYSAPISYLPVFQKVSTNRGVSKFRELKEAHAVIGDEHSSLKKLDRVAEMKTHLVSSVFCLPSSVAAISDQLSKCQICGRKISELFYFCKTDYEGKISNLSAGQLAGIPAVVFASDLYDICKSIKKGNSIQSIIIDGSNTTALLNQLDALDDLIHLHVPITIVVDIANSFELDQLTMRGFNTWRWNNQSLTQQLYDVVPLSSDKRIKNCAKQMIEYQVAAGEDISFAMRKLSSHRGEAENYSPSMMRLFEKLNNLTFSALRSILPLSYIDSEMAQQALEECSCILKTESIYLTDECVSDYQDAIKALSNIYTVGYCFKKEQMLKEYLKKYCGSIDSENESAIILVIPERSNKNTIIKYWQTWCAENSLSINLNVLFPSEYYILTDLDASITIICGWLKRAIMRKIIYSFNTSRYLILMYDYEDRWKKHDSRRWEKALSLSSNKDIVVNALSANDISISTSLFEPSVIDNSPEEPDELGELELVLRENKFRQYASGGRRINDSVQAIPINFVGGLLAFYRTTHRVISATRVIMEESNTIEIKTPDRLAVGDFVVVRESDRDLIREIADKILSNSGKSHLREVAATWREALQIELVFRGEDDFFREMHAAGCTKNDSTIRHWIDDDSDTIAPSSKEDLQIIAQITGNETLQEKLDDVYFAAQEVRRAHVLAGRKLSEQLRKTIVGELRNSEEIDPYNIWEPIDMEIDGIGNVKILKIIDIGSEIIVDASDTNRLITD